MTPCQSGRVSTGQGLAPHHWQGQPISTNQRPVRLLSANHNTDLTPLLCHRLDGLNTTRWLYCCDIGHDTLQNKRNNAMCLSVWIVFTHFSASIYHNLEWNHNDFVFIWKLCSCSLKNTSYIFSHFNPKWSYSLKATWPLYLEHYLQGYPPKKGLMFEWPELLKEWV